jgi:hypothetical protein
MKMVDDVVHPPDGGADLMLEAIAVRCGRGDEVIDFALTIRGACLSRDGFDARGSEWPPADEAAERQLGVIGAGDAGRQREDERQAANVNQRRHGRSQEPCWMVAVCSRNDRTKFAILNQ